MSYTVNDILTTGGKAPSFYRIIALTDKSATLAQLPVIHEFFHDGHLTHHLFKPDMRSEFGGFAFRAIRVIRRAIKSQYSIKVGAGKWGDSVRAWDGESIIYVDDNLS